MEKYRLLDLSAVERLTLEALPFDSSLRVADIVRLADLPRTSVVEALKRLHSRGLARSVPVGKHNRFKRSRTEHLPRLLSETSADLGLTDVVTMLRKSTHTLPTHVGDIAVVAGYEEVFKIIQMTFERNHKGRMIGIQVPEVLDYVPAEFQDSIVALNEKVKSEQIIIEAILPERTKRRYEKVAATDEMLAKSIRGRMTDAVLVEDTLLPPSLADIFVGEHEVLFVDWKNASVIYCTNPAIISLSRVLCASLKAQGVRFDTHSVLAG